MRIKILLTICLFTFFPNGLISLVYANEDTQAALFLALENAPDELAASSYAEEIWQQWFDSGNEQVDELMQIAMQKRRNYDFNGSIEILNKAIDLKPDFPEAWNQRATMFFMQEKYEASLEDIAKTLALEPRHFGALAGRAVIRLYQSKPALARQNIIEALKIHPFLKERAYFPGLVLDR
jgi:tetratricopeptide (TPR) repeat protein